MNKLCVIGIYFGKFKNYFKLWLKSCEFNSNVDFIVLTDNNIKISTENVKIYKTTLQQIKNRAGAVLGFECSLERPYKLCDYKPLYGLIFEKELQGYEYWGHCDFDLIFGDINYFFDEYRLYNYDRINALGHLSFYKNTKSVNMRFKMDGGRDDYKTVFTSDKIYIFDEIPGMTKLYLHHGFPMFTKLIYADISSVNQRFRVIDEYPLDEKKKNYRYQVFYWENGKCYRAYFDKGILKKEEYMYIHFKKRPNFEVPFDVEKISGFYITPSGFFPKMGEVTIEDVQRYNTYRPIKEMGEIIQNKGIVYIKRMLLPFYRIVKKVMMVD